MVLKPYERRKYTLKKCTPIPRLFSEGMIPPPPSSFDSSSYSASAVANIETDTSLTPENTLSMVSTPWSTETWYTDQESMEQSFKSWLSTELTASSLTPEPASTSSGELISSPFHSSSRKTLTLLSNAVTQSASRQMLLLNSRPETPETASTWTMETFTSTGKSDTNILRVKYPWSPCTVLSGSELYPSSLESYESRKVSRVSVSGTPVEGDSMTPMNYTFRRRQDQDPIVDWLLVKLNGLDVVDARV